MFKLTSGGGNSGGGGGGDQMAGVRKREREVEMEMEMAGVDAQVQAQTQTGGYGQAGMGSIHSSQVTSLPLSEPQAEDQAEDQEGLVTTSPDPLSLPDTETHQLDHQRQHQSLLGGFSSQKSTRFSRSCK